MKDKMQASTPTRPEAEILRERIHRELLRSAYSAVRRVGFAVGDRQVTLNGEVPTHFLRQVAVAAVAKVAPGYQIENRVRVVDPDLRTQTH